MITLTPIATVKNSRADVEDDNWGDVLSIIELDAYMPEDALFEIEHFSHAEIIYYFHKVDEKKIETGSRHPRNNPAYPNVGILSQRGKNRPNRLGATIVNVLKREGRQLHVQGLDAIDGTPILDIKPVMKEFLPRGEVRQPEWATDLMKNYWRAG